METLGKIRFFLRLNENLYTPFSVSLNILWKHFGFYFWAVCLDIYSTLSLLTWVLINKSNLIHSKQASTAVDLKLSSKSWLKLSLKRWFSTWNKWQSASLLYIFNKVFLFQSLRMHSLLPLSLTKFRSWFNVHYAQNTL